MPLKHHFLTTAALSTLALVAACSSTPMRNDGYYAPPPVVSSSNYTEYGQVISIEVIPMASRPSGAGAIIGAVIGGVVGNQFGSGTGRALATGAGVVGGAVAGNAIASRQKREDEVFRVYVRLDNGATRTMDFHRIDDLRVGDRVRFDGAQLYRY